MEKIEKDRDFCRTRVKGPRPKVEPILTILLVITKCFLHGRNKMDCLHLREWTFNAPVLGEIGKHLYFERDMLAPAIARLIHLLVPDAIYSSRKRAIKSAENSSPSSFRWEILRGPSGKPLNLDNLSKRVVSPLLKAVGREWHGWYSLRRGVATTLAGLTRDGMASKGLLCHTNLATTTRRYVKDVP
jgi:hypothetical protein